MKKSIVLICIFMINISIASEFQRIEGTEDYSGSRNDCHLVNNSFLDYSYFKFNIDSVEEFIVEAEGLSSWLKIEQPLFNASTEEYTNFAVIAGNENEFIYTRYYHNTVHGFKSVQEFELKNMGTYYRFTATSDDSNESMNGHDTCSFTVDLKQIKK